MEKKFHFGYCNVPVSPDHTLFFFPPYPFLRMNIGLPEKKEKEEKKPPCFRPSKGGGQNLLDRYVIIEARADEANES